MPQPSGTIDFSTVDAAAQKAADAAVANAQKRGRPGWAQDASGTLAYIWAYMWGLLGYFLYIAAVYLALPFATDVLTAIDAARNNAAAGFAEFAAKAVGEFMGVDIDPSNFSTQVGSAGNLQRAQQLGDIVHQMLLRTLVPQGEITPQSAEQAAHAFTGYMLNFSTTNSFTGILAEMLSDGKFEEWIKLGEDISENLGLQRLHRQAIRPLVTAAITRPYTRLMNQRYRGVPLSAAEAIKAFNRGEYEGADVNTVLQELGYDDFDGTELIQQQTPKLTAQELETLVRYGAMTLTEATDTLVADGIPQAVAQQRLQAQRYQQVDTIVQATISVMRSQVQNGYMDQPSFVAAIENFPITDEQKQWEAKLAGAPLEFPRRRLTLAQVQTLLELGQEDLGYLSTFTAQEGYSVEDQFNLEVLTLQKLITYEQAQAAKSAKAAAKAAKTGAKGGTSSTLTAAPNAASVTGTLNAAGAPPATSTPAP